MPFDAEDGALRDILYHIDLAQRFAQGYDHESFSADTLRVYAVTRCLEIISEATRRLSDELKARHHGMRGSKWPVPETCTATIMKM